jgi:predicted dehydrogenase
MPANRTCQQAGTPPACSRRDFLAAATALAAAAATRRAPAAQADPARYRVGVIGHTGRGNYGHGLDRVWLDLPQTRIVAVADADEKGRAGAVKRLEAPKGYADYRRMLDEVKPDLVSICPRWLDQHRDMVVAAAEGGVRGIYLEKPMCRTLAEADEMVAACEKNNVKLVIAHQTRYSPRLEMVKQLIARGEIGRVLELRGRGKEDARGGGEDLWVLGTHVMNLMHALGGEPLWCYGRVEQDGHPIRANDVKDGNEGIGPLAGDSVTAVYGMASGARAYFGSVRNQKGNPSRFGLQVFGSEGIIDIYTGHLPPVFLLRDSSWSPGRSGKEWIPVSSAGIGKPEPLEDGGLHGGNVLAVKDLIAAVEEDRLPVGNIYEARTATEMIVSVFESQRVGGPVTLPLKNRKNPLAML